MARRLSSFARPRSLVALVAATLVAALLATIPGAPPVAAADTQTSGVPAAAPPVAKVSAPPMSSPCDKKQAAASVTSKGRDLAATMPVVARTDKTTTYQGPCGTQTIEIHQNATNWKDAAGTWYPIDRTLARTPAGHWKNTSGPFTVDLADRADAAAVATVGQGAWNIGFSLQGAKGASTTASGDAATYRNVMSGIDLDEAVTGSGLKESVVVNTLPAGSGDLTFDFPLTLIGVTPSTAADGLIVFSTAGVTVATLAPAVAWDANKAPVPGAVIPVTQTLVPSTGGWAIHLSVPAAWARDPARALPITVDPSINLQNTGTSPGCTGGQDQDAFASSPDANGVYCDWTADGGQHEDWVGYDNWSPVSQQWTYQNFDMSQLYGKDIISATWYDQVIAHKVGDPNWTDYFKIAAVSNWVNNSPTWNLGDVHWSTAGDQGVIGHHADTWHDVRVAPGNQAAVNVQAEVAFWANRSWSPALGFELDTAGHNDAVHLASNQAPGLIGPAIYVTYNTIPNVPDQLSPASGWTGPTGSPRLFAHYSDPDGDSGNVDFEVYGPNSYYVFQPVGTSNGGTPYLDLNATTPGTYSWHVRAWDGRDTSNWSAGWQTFTIGDNPPNIPDQLTPSDGNLSVTQPALSARYSDPDNFTDPAQNIGTLQFEIDGVGTFDFGGLTNGATGSYTPPSWFLPGDYSWHVRAKDAVGAYSGWSAWRGFGYHPDAVWMADDFTGNNGSLWNSTKWATSSGLTVSGNQGIFPTATASKRATATGPILDDSEVSLTYSFQDRNTGSSLRVTLRGSGATGANQMPNGYRLDIPSGSDTVTVNSLVNGSVTPLGSFTYARNTNPQRLRFRVEGSEIQARIWAAGALEPGTWGTDVTDDNNGVTTAGTLQIAHAFESSGRTLSVDDVTYSSNTSFPERRFTATANGYTSGDSATTVALGTRGSDPMNLKSPIGPIATLGGEPPYESIVFTPNGSDATLGTITQLNVDTLKASAANGTWDRQYEPLPGGVSTTDSLKTALAPTAFDEAVSLPTGWSLSLQADNSIVVRDSAGADRGYVFAPSALDATGITVPIVVSLLPGNVIHTVVAHTGGSYTYPIANRRYRLKHFHWGDPGQGPGGNQHFQWVQDTDTDSMHHYHYDNNRGLVDDGHATLDLKVTLNGRQAVFDMPISVQRPAGYDPNIGLRVEIRCKENVRGGPDHTCKGGANGATKTFVFDNRKDRASWKSFYRFQPQMLVGSLPSSGEKKYFFEVYVRPLYAEQENIILPGGVGEYRVYDITCTPTGCFFNAAVPSGTGA